MAIDIARYMVEILGDSSGAEKAFKDAEKAGERSSGRLSKIANSAAAQSATVMGVAAAGLSEAMGAASNEHQLAAELGLSPAEAKKAGQVAGEMYRDGMVASAAEANAAVTAVAQNLADVNDPKQMSAMTEQVLAFSKAFGMDATESVRAVSQMLRTGMASSAEEAFDILAVGAQNGANKADDLVDTFNEYGTQFRKLGLDGKQSLGLISQAVAAGARDSDVAADALKEFSIRAIDGSEATTDGFKAIGLNAGQMAAAIGAGGDTAAAALSQTLSALKAIEDPVKREAAAVALFGTQAEDLGAALYAMDPATAAAAKGMGNLDGAASRVVKNIEDTLDPLTQFKNAFMGALGDIVGKALPVVEPLLALMVQFAPVLAPIAVVLAGVAAALRVVALAQAAWTAAVGAFNVVMAMNPIGLVIIAIVALVAALVLAYKKSETFRKIVDAVWSTLKTTVVGAAKAIWSFLTKVWEVGTKLIVGYVRLWLKVVSTVVKAILAVVRFYVGAWLAVFRTVGKVAGWFADAFSKGVAKIREWLGKGRDAVTGWIDDVLGFFADLDLFDAGKKLIGSLIDGLISAVPGLGGAMDFIGSKIGGFLPGSPVKEGPLRSWNRGGAGKRLVGMLADGLSDTRPVDRAMAGLAGAASGSFNPALAGGVHGGVAAAGAWGRTVPGGAPTVLNQTYQFGPGTTAADAEHIKKMVREGNEQLLRDLGVVTRARSTRP